LIVEAFNSMLAAISLAGSHPRDPAIAKMLGGGLTNSAGVKVTVDKILALPAIKRGIQIITDKLFGLPWYVLEINEDGRQYSRNHPAWKCVHWMANPMLSAPSFRQILTQWAMTRGNGCAWIDRSGPSWELYPLNPDETKPIVLGARDAELLEDQSLVGQLRIGTKVGGKPVLLELDDVYHIKGYGQSPYWGADITETMGEVFGGVIAKDEFSNRFFGQGANPVGFITMDKGLEEEDEETYMRSLQNAMQGLGKAHKIILLEDGAKFTPITIDPQKSQMLEGKQFDVRLMAMAIGIKPHKLIDSANAAFASLEQANSEHNDDDILPWINKHRAESDRKLLQGQEGELGTHCVDCDDEGLIYIPYAERAAAVVNTVNNGINTRDEGREKLGYAPSGSARGSQYRIPANILYEEDAVIVSGSTQTGNASEEPAKPDHSDVAKAYLDRIEKRLAAQAKDKAKDVKAFLNWLDNLKAEDGPASIQSQINDLYAVTIKRLNTLAETATTPEQLQESI